MMEATDKEGNERPFRRDLLDELLRRRDIDQAERSAFTSRDPAAIARLMRIDEDNIAWLRAVVDRVGWPGCSLVGEEGAHAAWLLAQHADRDPAFQQRCLALMVQAARRGEASPADVAHLTDRVRLANGEKQLFGTQISACDGRYVPCRLQDSETVDTRRAAVGLGPLAAHLARALKLYGPPKPAHMPCPGCREPVELWLPELGGQRVVSCGACGYVIAVRARMRPAGASARPSGQSRRSGPQDETRRAEGSNTAMVMKTSASSVENGRTS